MEPDISLVSTELEYQLFLTEDPEPLLDKYSLQELSQVLSVKLSEEFPEELPESTRTEKKEPFSLVPLIRSKTYSKYQKELEQIISQRNFSPELLAEKRKEIINDYLDRLWKKYQRIDLVKWDLLSPNCFFDYFGQKFVSFDYLLINIVNYPTLAIRRLLNELEEFQADPRNGWSLTSKEESYSKFQQLLEKCKNLLLE